MDEKYLTPIEIYMTKVFKIFIVIIPSIALCAGGTFTILHLLGFYETVKLSTMIIFDITCVIYTILGILLSTHCIDENGQLKNNVFKAGKIFMALLMLVQWNFISYMIPSRDFWAYSFFFVILAVSYLDSKYLLLIIGEISISIIVSWIIKPDVLLPVRDEYFIPELTLRIVLMILCFTAIWVLTETVERRFVKELEKISDFDTLTLLYNRRKLDKFLTDARLHTNGNFSVVMSDIDDFKVVNDTFGHSCGDEVLKVIANTMRSIVGTKGHIIRYGGEEILIILFYDEEKSVEIADNIRKAIQENIIRYEGTDIKITMTFGVANYTQVDTNDSLIKRADSNLYYGKNHGKNCVIK